MLITGALAGLVASASGIQNHRSDMKEHPLDWGTLNATTDERFMWHVQVLLPG